MKKIISLSIFIICIMINCSYAGIEVPETIRIGLYSGTRAVDSFKVSSKTGMEIGTINEEGEFDLIEEVKANKEVSIETLNAAFKANANVILKYTEDPVVSSDIIGNRCGALVDGSATKVLDCDNHVVKVVAWYDNELGYTCQMLRTMIKLLKLDN